MTDDLDALASDTEVRDRRAGMLTGFVLLAEYLDDQGEPCTMTLFPQEQRTVATIRQANALALLVEHEYLRRDV